LSSVKSENSNVKSIDSQDGNIGMDIEGDKENDDDDDDDDELDDQLKALISGGLGDGPTTVAELEHDEHEGMDEAILHEHEEITKVKNVSKVLFGKNILECWYYSPFPKEYHPNGPVDMLYFCEFTFRFFRTKGELTRYQQKPNLPRHPPGNEIYRDSNVSMFEVDGAVEKYYCQNLCYFAKLFLDHKTLYFDVDPFFFYVLCTQDERGFHPVGFYSKEKYSDAGYNLACILTFPSSQRQGYGRFLISFSYELSKKEEKIGSPEKPLSDLGAVSYRSYWACTLLRVLRSYPGSDMSIMDLTKMTSIVTEDVVQTLNFLGLLQYNNGKYTIYAPPQLIEDLLIKYPVGNLPVDPDHLHWAPLIVTDPRKDKWSIKFYS
jgi:histone acetyltransferase MYST1